MILSLAFQAGGRYIARPVDLVRDMDDITLGMWAALQRTDPWGERRADLRAGIIASTIVNWSGRQLREGTKSVEPSDYMPYAQADARRREVQVSQDIRTFFLNRGK